MNTIDTLLKELLTLDPSLKAHEARLRKVLSMVLAAKPEVRMDPVFYEELRETLWKQLAAKEEAPQVNRSPWRRVAYAFGGMALVAAVVFTSRMLAPVSSWTLVPAGQEAYGPLNSGGGGDKGGDGGSPVEPSERINYHFSYTGEPLDVPASVDVLHRLSGLTPLVPVEGVDLKSFGPLYTRSVAFDPVDEDGYSVSFDYEREMLNIYENIKRTPDCPWGWCKEWSTEPLTAAQVPAETTLVSVADGFLKDHGISTALYGKPTMETPFVDPGTGEISYQIAVFYPYLLNGESVYYLSGAMSGGVMGMQVNIDVHREKVITVDTVVLSNRFETSAYPAATEEQVLATAAQGGVAATPWTDPTKTVELELGTPEKVFANMDLATSYDTQHEFYVPAYKFPVSANSYGFEYVLVPLAADMLN